MTKKGPFGLWRGMTLSDFEIQPVVLTPGQYAVTTVPKPHSAFEYYFVQITPQCGLSMIRAMGVKTATSAYGIELLLAFDALEAKLASTYGKGNRSDFLMLDSIWSEPRDWMQSLLSKERVLFVEWSSRSGSTLPESLESIQLSVLAEDTESAAVFVTYTFDNKVASNAEIAAAEDDAL